MHPPAPSAVLRQFGEVRRHATGLVLLRDISVNWPVGSMLACRFPAIIRPRRRKRGKAMNSREGLAARGTTIWPLVLAPLVTGVYYWALRRGFSLSLPSVVSDASDVNPSVLGAPTWGTHWLYRAFAEAVSVPFGIFIAAGIAREKAKIAGIIGGLSISLFYLLRNLFVLYAAFYLQPYLQSKNFQLTEPWYQHVIEGFIIIGAALLGFTIGEAMKETASKNPQGFIGINRLHFLWLWLAVVFYSWGIIAPLLNAWIGMNVSGSLGFLPFGTMLDIVLPVIVYGLPVGAYIFPLSWGMKVLAHESSWSPRMDNIIGPVILIVGWFLATGIVFVWAWMVIRVQHLTFG